MPFLLIGVAVVLAMAAYGAYVWVPVWFHLPVSVTVNSRPYKVDSGTKIHTFLDDTFGLASYQGKLKVDTGQVLDPRGGKPAVITVDGHPLHSGERIRFGGNAIKLARGADVIHPTAQKSVAIAPKVSLQGGNGRLISLLRAGRPGTVLETIDTVTGKVLSSKEATSAIDTRLQAFTTTGIKARAVALTFDDGPNDGETQAIVATLKKENVKATFFELGINIKRYPALTRAVVSGGNLVGLHSWDHKDFTKLSTSQISGQLSDSQAAYKAATGQATQWFRLPYGASTLTIDGQLTSRNFRLAYWTVDPNDWRRPGVDKIVSRVVSGARPGAIILMHDGGGDRSQTVAALPKIIAALKKQGYTFVTVDELYRLSGGK
ncbi:MAG: polysaccharide deacetylase family protein [Coriobacteriia bacterium]|nr:polysaccharide deacetylase family protein [Coriobacteriia bacterium]